MRRRNSNGSAALVDEGPGVTMAQATRTPIWLAGFFALAALSSPLLLMFGNKSMVVVLAVLAVPSVAALGRGGAWRHGWNRAVLVAGGVLLAWAALSVLWAHVPALVLPKAARLLGLSVCGLSVCAAARLLDETSRRRVLQALGAGFVLAAAVAALLSYIPSISFLAEASGIDGEISLSHYKNIASAGMVMSATALAAAWQRRAWVFALLLLATIVLLVERTGNLTGGVALLLVLVAAVVPCRWGVALAAAFSSVLFMALPLAHLLPGSAVLARALPFLPNSFLHRTEIWRFAAERAWERPFLGWGLDASRELPGGDADVVVWIRLGNGEIGRFPSQILPLHPHDFLLQVWLELGLVGVVLLAVLLVVLLAAVRRSSVAVTTLVAALAVAAASFSLWQSWWMATLFLSAAMAVALTQEPSSQGRVP